jgi:hypothetical protein
LPYGCLIRIVSKLSNELRKRLNKGPKQERNYWKLIAEIDTEHAIDCPSEPNSNKNGQKELRRILMPVDNCKTDTKKQEYKEGAIQYIKLTQFKNGDLHKIYWINEDFIDKRFVAVAWENMTRERPEKYWGHSK